MTSSSHSHVLVKIIWRILKPAKILISLFLGEEWTLFFLSSPSDSDGQPGFRTHDLEDGGAKEEEINALEASTGRIRVIGSTSALLLLRLLSQGHMFMQYRNSAGRRPASRMRNLLLTFKETLGRDFKTLAWGPAKALCVHAEVKYMY